MPYPRFRFAEAPEMYDWGDADRYTDDRCLPIGALGIAAIGLIGFCRPRRYCWPRRKCYPRFDSYSGCYPLYSCSPTYVCYPMACHPVLG